MKKLLLATTVLAASASFAAAEVSVSGTGRMGVVYDGEDIQFSNRIRVIFDMSGTTDGGLEFGASIRADNSGGGNTGGWDNSTTGDSGSIWISGAFGTLAMGDVASAAESINGDLAGVGYTGLGDLSDMDYLVQDGNDLNAGPSVLFTYSTGPVSLALSATDGVNGTLPVGNPARELDTAWSLGAGYSMDAYSFGLGYSERGDDDQIAVSAGGEFGAVAAKLVYLKSTIGGVDADTVGLSGSYTSGPLSVSAFYKQHDIDGLGKFDAFGLGAGYDLGGGAALKGGIVDGDLADAISAGGEGPIADFGMTFSF